MSRRFEGFSPAEHIAETASSTAAWLTGQSAAHHSHLSPDQLALLADLAARGFTTIAGGFPYNRAALRGAYRPEPILAASVRNASQHLAASRNGAFARDVALHLQPVLDRTARHLLLLCGSTGAQMLGAALPHLRLPATLVVQVVALGPVGRLPSARPGLRVHVVQGDRDPVSRWGSRATVDTIVRGGHLDYARHPDVRAVVLRLGEELIA